MAMAIVGLCLLFRSTLLYGDSAITHSACSTTRGLGEKGLGNGDDGVALFGATGHQSKF